MLDAMDTSAIYNVSHNAVAVIYLIAINSMANSI